MRQLKISKSITNREQGTLDKYLADIAKEPMISPDEEVELAQRIKMGDQIALDKLVRANLRFVVSVAKQYQNQGLSLADLINEGNVGLIKAAQRFDETKGFKFISYAVWWILVSGTNQSSEISGSADIIDVLTQARITAADGYPTEMIVVHFDSPVLRGQPQRQTRQ